MVETLSPPTLIRGVWRSMTAEEFDEWVPAGAHAEWVDGKGIIFVTTSSRHVRFARLLKVVFDHFLQLTGIGEMLDAPFEMRLRGGASRREPDIMIVLNEHRARIGDLALEGPADFVVEFISRRNAENDLVVKRREYAEAGVPEYLTVETRDNRNGIELLRLGSDGQFHTVHPDAAGRVHSIQLPGLWIDPAWFQREPPFTPDEVLMQLLPDAYLHRVQTLYNAR